MRTSAALAAALLVLIGQGAFAQGQPLKLNILTEVVSGVGDACGVNGRLERSALRAAMRDNRVAEERAPSAGGASFVYSNVNTIINGTICISSVRLEIKKYVSNVENGWGPASGELVLCAKESLVAGTGHAALVTSEIRTLFGQCLAQMQDNVTKHF